QGKELLDELKHSHACTVRILTSAYGEMAVAMDAVNDGEIFRYQKKPWRAGDCLPLFQEALARHRWLVNERARVQADLKHQFETLYSGRIKRLDVLQSVVSETAGRPVLMDFIQALQRIQPLPANASHLRASLA